jgi:hypothetical protein
MYRIWYWATIDREYDIRFIASLPDFGTSPHMVPWDKEGAAHVADLAGQRARAALEDGQHVPSGR